MEWPKVTLFGDSITRRSMDPDQGCWASMIAHRLGAFFDVDIRGFDGYNSRRGLELMNQLFPKSYLDKVEIFTLFFGHNDSFSNSPLHVPLDEYERNVRAILEYLKENGLDKKKIILLTPTWYHDESFKEFSKGTPFAKISKDLESARHYSEAIKRLANDMTVDVVDFFEISVKQGDNLEKIFSDGIHLSKLGATLLFESLMPTIEKKLEATFKKPIGDLWHVKPLEQLPELKDMMSAIQDMKK